MSAPNQILSSSVPVAISSDGGVTYKNVVCKKSWDYSGNATVTQEETDCGVLTGVGAIKDTYNFEFILNTTPNGGSEWGSDAIINFFQSKTQLTIKTTVGSITYYRTLVGYITDYTETAPQGGMISAKGTFKGSGVLDWTF